MREYDEELDRYVYVGARKGLKEQNIHFDAPKHVNRYGRRLCRTMKAWQCSGCGRTIPKGSWVVKWELWLMHNHPVTGRCFNERVRLRFCSDCQDVIYGCPDRPVMKPLPEEPIVKTMCGQCEVRPFCGRVDWLDDAGPDDIWFGGIEEMIAIAEESMPDEISLRAEQEQRAALVELKRSQGWDGPSSSRGLEQA